MCIIVYKPKGTEMPEEKVLKACFENNPDGAGVSFSTKGGVVFIKGLMTYDAFKKTIDSITFKQTRDIVMHFRITTSGGTRKDMCHPFNIGTMISPSKSDCVLHHNGVLFRPMTSWYSDTAIFAWMFRKNFEKTIRYYMQKYSSTNRFAIHATTGVTILGTGWVEDGGCMYSNSTYLDDYGWGWGYGKDYGLYDGYCDGEPTDITCDYCGGNRVFEFMLNVNTITECSDCGIVNAGGSYDKTYDIR